VGGHCLPTWWLSNAGVLEHLQKKKRAVSIWTPYIEGYYRTLCGGPTNKLPHTDLSSFAFWIHSDYLFILLSL
jgi:hypothetical protein